MHPVEVVASEGGGTWELFRDERGVPVVKNEIRSAGDSTYERAMVLAEVRKLMRAAVEGRLDAFHHVKDIRRKPSVFELRWEIGDQYVPLRLWRLYFVWWRNLGPLRLALRFAEKPRGPQGNQVQNADIDLAWKRYTDWQDWQDRQRRGSINSS